MDEDKIVRLKPRDDGELDFVTEEEVREAQSRFDAEIKSSEIRDAVVQLQNAITAIGEDQIAGVVTLVIARDAEDSLSGYTPSCFRTANGIALTLGHLETLKRDVLDEADNLVVHNALMNGEKPFED